MDQSKLDQNGIEKKNTLTVIDNRTGKSYEINIQGDSTAGTPYIHSTEFSKIVDEKGKGVLCMDKSFMNTAVAHSKITYIDGKNGILRYRGYDIETLAENSSFLEVAYLLIWGELPNETQFKDWENKIMTHTFIHENLLSHLKSYRYDAHPMSMLISSMAALSSFYADANPALTGPDIFSNDHLRNKQIFRILGKITTISACVYRHRIGRSYNSPVNHLSYTENFLYMMDRLSETNYRPHPKLTKALDILFILHADHEMNNSTAAMRHISSTKVDPYTSVASAAAALYGPLHGGANERVLHMLEEIGSEDNIPEFLEDVKKKKKMLMGFGHRIYKNYDPRAKLIKKVALDVFELCGENSQVKKLWKIANKLEQSALQDDYFISRKLFPNIDFYSGLIYKSMGFPTDMFPVLFTIPRVAGWLAHWVESISDKDAKIFRPRQVYTGDIKREFVPMTQRDNPKSPGKDLKLEISAYNTRRHVSIQYFNSNKNLLTPITTGNPHIPSFVVKEKTPDEEK